MKKIMVMLAGAIVLGSSVWAANLPKLKDATKEDLAKIIGADYLKKGATVPSVLVFYRCEGFVHGDAIVSCNEAFRLAAERTGAFKVDFSDDYDDLKAENLRKYDVLVMNNTTGLKTREHAFMAQSLPEFTASGKGYVAYHAGVDTFSECLVIADMTSGLFAGHPWGAGGTWSFKLLDAKNPINRAFADEPKFKVSDEIYQSREPAFIPAKIHPLLALDFDDPEVAKQNGKVRPDSTFYPVSWIKPYGKGRVFYTTFGHDDRAWRDPKRLRHMFDGFLYAAGLLKCDDTQMGVDVEEIKKLDSFQKVEAAFRRVLGPNVPQSLIDDTVKKMNALLKDPSASEEVKEGTRKALRGFGAPNVEAKIENKASPEMVKVFTAIKGLRTSPAKFASLMKGADQTVQLALVQNASAVPAKDLVAAYDTVDDRVKAAILIRLAAKKAPEGAKLANAALASDYEDLAVAAGVALAKLGSAEDVPALVAATKRGGRIGRNAENALRGIADPAATVKLFELAAADNDLFKHCARRADSKQLALWLPFVKNEKNDVRKSAWRALSRQLTDKNLVEAVAWLAKDFRDEEVSAASSAFKAASKFADQDLIDKTLVAAWKGASDPAKRLLAQIMGQHPSPALTATLSAGLVDANADVRKTSADGFGSFVDYKVVDILLKAYASEKEEKVQRAELDAMFKVAAATSPDLRKDGVRLFKASKEADRTYVAKFILRSSGVAGFDDIQALFGDAKYGPSAKKSFLEMFDELSGGSTGDMARPIESDKWTAKANRNDNSTKRAFDGNAGSRWDTGRTPDIGDWFALGLGANVFVSEIILNEEGSRNDGLPAGEVYVSNDGETWNGPVSKFGKEATVDGITRIEVNAPAKWIKIVATAVRNGNFWSIHEIEVKSGIGKDTLEKLSKIADGLKK